VHSHGSYWNTGRAYSKYLAVVRRKGKRVIQLYGSIRCLDQRFSDVEVTVSLLEAMRLRHCVQAVTAGALVAPVWYHVIML
jgi:hypothetical protein